MRNEQRDTGNGALWGSAPKAGEPAAFTSSPREIAAAVLSYVPAYLYLCIPLAAGPREYGIVLLVFVALLVGITELLCRDTRPDAESPVWLGCLLITALCLALGRCRAWGGTAWATWSTLLLHGFGVYWILARSGRLCRGKSSCYLPLDALHGVFRFPFGSFMLRLRCLLFALTRRGKGDPRRVAGAACAVLVALLLFGWAVKLLAGADRGFAGLTEQVRGWLSRWDSVEFWWKCLLSLPVGMYLFGLIAGSHRTAPETLSGRADTLRRGIGALRRVPVTAWVCALGAFCALYLLFFVLQGSYLFGAFTRTLPPDFTVAEYARQGFFELCKIMALNFALVWLVLYCGDAPLREKRALKLMTTVLLSESLLFALTAFSKLALYISCFSFTPRRLQSVWLICCLSAGSLLCLYHIWTRRPVFRKWLLFSGVTAALLCIY